MPPKKVVKKPAAPKRAQKKLRRGAHAEPVKQRSSGMTPAAPVAEKTAEEPGAERYWEAVGRRKTAVARVRLFTRGDKSVTVNGAPMARYLPQPHLQKIASAALETMKSTDRFRASVKVKGGGLHAQAEAIRHGTARALVLFNLDFRKRLKRAGFLTRDPRMKERKKFGLKGARRAPQWAKR